MDKTPAQPTLINNGITCRTCAHLRIHIAPLSYQCVANPPTPVAAAMAGPQGQVQWTCTGFFPPIGDPDAIWCGKWVSQEQH